MSEDAVATIWNVYEGKLECKLLLQVCSQDLLEGGYMDVCCVCIPFGGQKGDSSKPVADLGGIQGCERTPLWTLANYLFINYLYYYSRY